MPESLVRLTSQWRNQQVVFSTWIAACKAQGQAHLLVPLIAAYADQAASLAADQARLTALGANLPLTDRQPARALWAAALEPLQDLTACHQTSLRTHPIDREGVDHILLAEAARLQLAATRATLQAAARHLTNAIG